MRIQPASFAFTVLQPLPQIAGAAVAIVQMTSGAVSSALLAGLYDGSSMLSTTILVTLCSVTALISYLPAGRPARSRVAGFSRAHLGRSVTPAA